MDWETGIDIDTLLCIKQITDGNYCTEKGTLLSALWSRKWEEIQNRGDLCTHVADPLSCIAETNTTL